MQVGTDIIEISRIAEAIENMTFLQRVYSENERRWLDGKPAQSYAGMFAAKEACVKAGGGVISDYEINHEESGKPYITTRKPGEFLISISHCEEYATAVVIKM